MKKNSLIKILVLTIGIGISILINNYNSNEKTEVYVYIRGERYQQDGKYYIKIESQDFDAKQFWRCQVSKEYYEDARGYVYMDVSKCKEVK